MEPRWRSFAGLATVRMAWNLALEYIQRDDRDQAAVRVPGQQARLPVDPGARSEAPCSMVRAS